MGAADSINGGAGTDTLKVTVDGVVGAVPTTVAAADVKNIEVISIRNVQTGAATDLNVTGSNFVGATEFVNDRSTATVNFNNIGTADVTVQGNGVAVHTATNITVGAAAVTDAFVLNIKDGVKGGSVNVNEATAKWTDATINSTGAANTVGAVNLSGTGVVGTHTVKNLTINAATDLTATGITGFDVTAGVTNTITVKGAAAKVSIGTLATAVDVVDASGLTAGGVTAQLDSTVTGIKFTGGAGNDVITSAGVQLAAGASVDAGAGTADRLVLTAAIAADTAGKASAALYKGFEELSLNASQDVSIFTGSNISKLVLNGTLTATNVSAAQAANVQVVNSGTYTVDVKDATVVGNLNTVHITADDGVAGLAVGPIALTPALAGVETLQLTANDNVTVSDLTLATALNSIKLDGAATIDLTTGAVNLAANSVIDASAATGAVTINAAGAQAGATTGLSIKGGAGNDVLIGTVKADVINAGAGNDVLATGAATATPGSATATTAATVLTVGVSTASDVLTGGAGNDSFAIGHIDSIANVSSITDLNLGTNVVAGAVDSLWFATAAPLTAATIVTLTAAQQTAVSAAADLGAAVNLVLATASAVNNVAQFTFGTDTYLVTNGVAGGAAYVPAEDNLIKITGVAGVLDASDIHFVAA